MLPKPSLCLKLPKTGTTYTARFMAAADWLHLGRACRIRRLRVPGRAEIEAVNAVKRLGLRFGSLNPLIGARHPGYSALPARLRACPRLCALRDVEGWHASQYLYYTRRMKGTLLERSILFLRHGRRPAPHPALRALLLRHGDEFLQRLDADSADPVFIENVPMPFLVWFNRAIRGPFKLKRWFGIDAWPAGVGYLTFRTIALLFADPARVFALPGDAFQDHFASGRYRRDLRADFYLDFHALTDGLCALMAGELGYDPAVLEFLADRLHRRNVSPADLKPPVVAALRADGLIGRIRRRERIYERYLLPLAAGDRPAAPGPPQTVPRP